MKIAILTVSLAFIVFVLSALGQVQEGMKNELILEKAVEPHAKLDDIYRRFSEGYKKLDPAAVTNLYTYDAFYLSLGSEIKRGREKILADFASFLDSVRDGGGNLSISFRILDRRVSGDLACDVGIYTLDQKRPNSEDRTSTGKFVVVARRMNNGDWRFHIDSYSDLPKVQNSSSLSTKKVSP
jgi:ketosteroid isomerase-like protein